MKVIGFEEHYKLPAISAEHHRAGPNPTTDLLQAAGFGTPDGQGDWPPGIYELGAGRIAAMDDAGIDVQILSHSVPGPETLEPTVAAALAGQANDAVAAAVAQYPDRLRGFATLPMRDPVAAATELERSVRQHGFVGALINAATSTGATSTTPSSGRCSRWPKTWACPSICIRCCRRNR